MVVPKSKPIISTHYSKESNSKSKVRHKLQNPFFFLSFSNSFHLSVNNLLSRYLYIASFRSVKIVGIENETQFKKRLLPLKQYGGP